MSAPTATASADRPNVIQILIDDLGYSDVGFNDHDQGFETPTIDALAADGMTFSRAYAAQPSCSPCRASIQTGQHPARIGMPRHIPHGWYEGGVPDEPYNYWAGTPTDEPSRNWLPLDTTTLPEVLAPLDYHTAFFGKWHLGHEPYHPVEHGYDEQHGVAAAGSPHRYFPPYWDHDDPFEDVAEDTYLTDRLVEEVVDFLQDYDREEPFAACLWTYAVHEPKGAPEALIERYRERGYEEERAVYGAMVTAVDRALGRVIETLQEQGLWEETAIIFAGDQGAANTNPPLRGHKGASLYEGGARIPMAVRWPGGCQAGTRTDDLVSTVDLFPTILELAGGDPLAYPELDGRSLVPSLRGRSLNRDALVYGAPKHAALVEDDWKLIARPESEDEVYNLQTDPYETTNVAGEYPDLYDRLRARLRTWEAELDIVDGWTPPADAPDLPEEVEYVNTGTPPG